MASQQPKRGPGRPKGSKNKATLEREALEAQAAQTAQKRGPGRPKGSRNKKTIEREGQAVGTARALPQGEHAPESRRNPEGSPTEAGGSSQNETAKYSTS